jgi:hypothetical protein
MNPELVRIYNYKNKQLYNLYYNKTKNEFYVKKSENTNFYIPLRWKHVHRWYTNKKNNENKYKVYRYVNFYNPQTKEKMRVTEKEWLSDRDKVIEENLIKEQVKNMTLEELWAQILEYIVNHNTTENIFNYNSGQNMNGETSEQQPQNIENNSEIESERVLQPNPNPQSPTESAALPSPPVSPLILPETTIPTNSEK